MEHGPYLQRSSRNYLGDILTSFLQVYPFSTTKRSIYWSWNEMQKSTLEKLEGGNCHTLNILIKEILVNNGFTCDFIWTNLDETYGYDVHSALLVDNKRIVDPWLPIPFIIDISKDEIHTINITEHIIKQYSIVRMDNNLNVTIRSCIHWERKSKKEITFILEKVLDWNTILSFHLKHQKEEIYRVLSLWQIDYQSDEIYMYLHENGLHDM